MANLSWIFVVLSLAVVVRADSSTFKPSLHPDTSSGSAATNQTSSAAVPQVDLELYCVNCHAEWHYDWSDCRNDCTKDLQSACRAAPTDQPYPFTVPVADQNCPSARRLHQQKECGTYNWTYSCWGQCHDDCTQDRRARCERTCGTSALKSNETECLKLGRPTLFQGCPGNCSYRWENIPLGPCHLSRDPDVLECFQRQHVYCLRVQRFGSLEFTRLVNDSFCFDHPEESGERPPDEIECGGYHWEPSPYGCDENCKQYQNLSCFQTCSMNVRPVEDFMCLIREPEVSRPERPPCPGLCQRMWFAEAGYSNCLYGCKLDYDCVRYWDWTYSVWGQSQEIEDFMRLDDELCIRLTRVDERQAVLK